MNREEQNKIEEQPSTFIKQCSPFTYINYNNAGVLPPEDIHIIKKTAEFYVLSTIDQKDKSEDGANDFLSTLKKELGEEEQFQFLTDQHPLNSVFKDFITQYRSILSNHKIMKDHNIYLRHCFERATYNEYKKQLERNNQESFNLYKIRFAAINWGKFHVVSNIENILKLQSVDKGNDNNGINIKASSTLSLQRTQYNEPLDFSKLNERKISLKETIAFLNKYFEESGEDVKLNQNSDTAQSKQSDIKKAKKRKGKMLIKGQGETRINKKKK